MIQELDTSNGVIFPFYDADSNIVYLCGKVRKLLYVRYVNYSTILLLGSKLTPLLTIDIMLLAVVVFVG
jgi:hypothetical protein